MSNSNLVCYTKLSPNFNPRESKITKITIHHMAGNLSVETCGNVFAPTSRQASSNYGVGSDGRIAMYVEEHNRAWTSSSPENDHQAVTIEVANDGGAPEWHVSDKALASTIALCVDICKRNNITSINYTGDKNGNLTRHDMFANTNCPGPYLGSKFPYIADEVNRLLESNTSTTPTPEAPSSNLKYGVGTRVCVEHLSRSADGSAGVVPSHCEGTITKVYPGTLYPYLLDDGKGFVNDLMIDADPHTPGVVTTTPKGADQIIYPNSKVTLPGVYTVTHIDVANNKIGSTSLTGAVSKPYHWIDATPCNEVNDGGAIAGDQIFNVGELFVIPGTYTALAIDVATDAVKLHIGNSDVWLKASECFEVSDN